MSKTLLLLAGLVVLASAQILNPSKLFFRYAFDASPAVDEGSLQRGTPLTYGNPTVTTGKLGNGYRFNANGAQTDLIAVGQYGITAPISVTAWFSVDSYVITNTNANNAPYYMKIFSNKYAYDDPQGLEIQYRPGVNQWTIITPCPGRGNCPDLANLVYNATYTADTFNHIAVTVTSNTVTMYINGVSVLNQGYNTPLTQYVPQVDNRQNKQNGQNGHQLVIGGSLNGATFNTGGEWHGVLDEVRLYNYSLSAADVTNIYNQGNLAQSTTGSGASAFSGFSCPATTTTSSTPSLVLYNDLLPKDSNGNQLPQFPYNYVTLHKLRNTTDPAHAFANPDYIVENNNVTTVTLKNIGSASISVTGITVSNATAFPISGLPNTFPVSLAAGATLQFTVAFAATLGVNLKSAARATISIASSDSVQPTLTVQCVGLYMDSPEGSNEVPLQTILNAFGYSINTNLGYEQQVNWEYSFLNQDEVSAQYWRAANPNQQVTVQQIAAFGGLGQNPTDNTVHQFGLYHENTSTIDCGQQFVQVYVQTVVPKCFVSSSNSIVPCYTTCNPSGRFYFGMDNTRYSVYSLTAGDDDGQGPKYLDNQVSWKLFPVRLADGSLVANAYVATQDYSLPKGCGDSSITVGVANCDYQDNIWVITNIQPADDLVSQTTTFTLPVSYSFSSSVDGRIADQNGNGLQFPGKFANSLDTHALFNSYQASNLLQNGGSLTITTSNGTPQDKTLVNALKVNLNPQSSSFYVQVTLDTTTVGANSYAGVMIGSDLYNYAAAYYHSNAVYFRVETQTGSQTFGSTNPFPVFTTVSPNVASQANPVGSSTTNITLILAVDPVAGTVTPTVAGNGQQTRFASAYTLPGIQSGFGVGPAGRLTGNGVGAGPIAWSDAGSTDNVKFYNFAANNCGGVISGSTTSSTGTGNGSGAGSGAGSGSSTTSTNSNSPTTTVGPNGGNGATTTTMRASDASTFTVALFVMIVSMLVM